LAIVSHSTLKMLAWNGGIRQICAFVVMALVLTGCQAGPDSGVERLDVPADADTIPILPQYDDPIWVAYQGLPLQRSWLREGRTELPDGSMFILPYVLTSLPYKNGQETAEWVKHVNATYQPEQLWKYDPKRRMGHYKCMSMSSSTILDWFALRRGETLEPYQSLLNGQTEHGFDHRAIDAIYFQRALSTATKADYPLLTLQSDPVERTPIPFAMKAFAEIITIGGRENIDGNEIIEVPDPSLPGVTHKVRVEDFPPLRYRQVFGYRPTSQVEANPEPVVDTMVRALETYGPLYAGMRMRFATSGGVITVGELGPIDFTGLSSHGVVVVGYIRQLGRTYFVYREVFGEYDEGWADGGPAYRVFPVNSFNEVWAFELVDSPDS